MPKIDCGRVTELRETVIAIAVSGRVISLLDEELLPVVPVVEFVLGIGVLVHSAEKPDRLPDRRRRPIGPVRPTGRIQVPGGPICAGIAFCSPCLAYFLPSH